MVHGKSTARWGKHQCKKKSAIQCLNNSVLHCWMREIMHTISLDVHDLQLCLDSLLLCQFLQPELQGTPARETCKQVEHPQSCGPALKRVSAAMVTLRVRSICFAIDEIVILVKATAANM